MQEQLKKKKRKEGVKYTLSRKRGSKSLERAPFTLPSNSLRILTCLSLEAGVRVRGRHGFEFQGRNRVDDDGQERVLGFRFWGKTKSIFFTKLKNVKTSLSLALISTYKCSLLSPSIFVFFWTGRGLCFFIFPKPNPSSTYNFFWLLKFIYLFIFTLWHYVLILYFYCVSLGFFFSNLSFMVCLDWEERSWSEVV